MSVSLWTATAASTRFPSLDRDIATDVAIVGGGITGVLCAALLAAAGARVVVLEARQVGEGTTGHSTGNLYAPVDWHLYRIAEGWDVETMQAVAHSRQDGVDLIEALVRRHGIDCGFARRPFCLFTTDAREEGVEAVEREYRAAIDAHLNARVSRDLPLPLRIEKALIVEGQAQFHPLDFVRGLATHILSDRCRIFEHSPALKIDDEHGVVVTAAGRVRAHHLVLATHTPKGVFAVQREMKPYREYGIGAPLRSGDYPEGIFWTVGTKHSIRTANIGGRRFLVVVGEKHPTGDDPDAGQRIPTLERFARTHFDVGEIAYGWSAQHYRSADELPYIGKPIDARHTYIATGFASDGLTYGAVSASILSEAIAGRDNKWSDLYDPTRVALPEPKQHRIHRTPDLKAWLRDPVQVFAQIRVGEADIMDIEGEPVAVHRDERGEVHAVSAACSHLGCTVRWNVAERTWDCPCHGSRFAIDGQVIEGPALTALDPLYRGSATGALTRPEDVMRRR